jgi:DNA polymerase-1
MIDVDHWIGDNNSDIKMIMQVHDELIFEVKKGFAAEALKNITRLMESSVKLDIPLIVDANTGANWNEAH